MTGTESISVGIVGSGMMGRGIAEAAATAGLWTTLVKATAAGALALARLRDEIAASLAKAASRGRLAPSAVDEAIARITLTGDLEALRACDVVVESVVEELPVKQQLVGAVEARTGEGVVIGTNTSSLRVSDVGARMRRPERLLGIHFFSPVAAMGLVDVAPTRETAPFAVERARALAEALGKTAVVVGDSSGYIVNRLLVPYLLDGMHALEAGVAAASDIDTAMRLGCGHPMGPLALADAIGLDVVYAMARTLYLSHGDRRYSPPALLRRLVLRGQLGRKAGAGIYDYSTKPPRENPAVRLVPEGAGSEEEAHP